MRITYHLRIAGTLALLAAGLHLHAQTINAYRYWFDDDGPSVVTTTVAGGQQYTLNNVDAAALPTGYHRITFQFRDSNNAWGVPTTSTFYRNGGQQVAYQYWFNDDVNTLVETAVGSTEVIDVVTQIDASALSNGAHTITLRTKDGQNGFSVPITYSFDVMVGIEEIPGLGQVLLFPNPATDMLHLRFDAQAGMDLLYDAVDAAGRVVIPAQRATVANGGTLEMSIAGWPSGTYQLRLTGNKGVRVVPFVKQ